MNLATIIRMFIIHCRAILVRMDPGSFKQEIRIVLSLVQNDHFRQIHNFPENCKVSSLGIGTFKGNSSIVDDLQVG